MPNSLKSGLGSEPPPPPFPDLEALKRALDRERARVPGKKKASAAAAGAKHREHIRREKLRQRLQYAMDSLEVELAELKRLGGKAGLAGTNAPAGNQPNVDRQALETPGLGTAMAAAAVPLGSPFAAGTENKNTVGDGFSLFIESIGDAMIKAQQKLDEESDKYLRGNKPGSQPAAFRLPRLRAEARFDLQETNGTTANLIFYRQTGSKEEQRSHSVEFEIVAVPPPPDFTAGPVPSLRAVPTDGRPTDLGQVFAGIRPGADQGLISDLQTSEKRVVGWRLNTTGDESLVVLAFAAAGESRGWLALVDGRNRILAKAVLDSATNAPLISVLARLSDATEKSLS